MTEERQYFLLVDDDPAITEALSMTLEREGRTTILCADVQSAETALARFPVTHVVTDVQFSGSFGFEGLHFLERVRALSPHCRIILITGYGTDALHAEAVKYGSSVLAKPFYIDQLEQLLGAVPADEQPYDVIRLPSIDEILHGDLVVPVFQPIVRLSPAGTAVFGFEALMRSRGNGLSGSPAMLFEYASRRARLPEMNIMAMTRAIEGAACLPDDAALFLNADPPAFDSHLVPALRAAAKAAAIPMARLVLEITERSAFADEGTAVRVFDELREAGVRFALDDHGSAYSHLRLINRILPSFIKISNGFGTGFECDPTKERIVRHTIALANSFGCETILEGIETDATARAAVEAGAALAQGYHFGRPSPAEQWTGPRAPLRVA